MNPLLDALVGAGYVDQWGVLSSPLPSSSFEIIEAPEGFGCEPLLNEVALAPIAVGTQDLEVLKCCRAAVGDRQDVVVLDVEVPPALDAAAPITLEDRAS